ncbi:hypothetical protein Tco_0512251 [Tanacetum coccineum]
MFRIAPSRKFVAMDDRSSLTGFDHICKFKRYEYKKEACHLWSSRRCAWKMLQLEFALVNERRVYGSCVVDVELDVIQLCSELDHSVIEKLEDEVLRLWCELWRSKD